ncbi:SpoIIE family protein phosphatase [Kitasatospora sp. MBT63]|uniref:SpoIIE family protein phosphatase n=1 Tax=Kitasatospora sp. MBT63 TaxID=1444768 RepID=UPI0009EC7114|nr:SpoIIE family protein phosphatase [Kitasatospora sp. MBT63]
MSGPTVALRARTAPRPYRRRPGARPAAGPGPAVPGGAEAGGRDALLDAALTETIRRCGATTGAVYLLPADEPVLHLAVLRGLPAEFIAPWIRAALASPLPVSDAVRERRLVWSGSQQEFARQYPRTAVALPYHFALAAAPIETPQRCWGALLLLWPASHSAQASPLERDLIGAECGRLARLLAQADAAGHPFTAPARPRVLPVQRPLESLPSDAAAAFAERLPGGSCSLDLNGRITYLTAGACELLGAEAEDLLGGLPWQSLPWLDDPAYEDRYRSALISRQPSAFTALRPPDHWLSFRLYPGEDGISIRITPAGPGPADGPPATRPQAGPVSRAGQLYQIMHLAAALTEAVSVNDVIDLVAEQILPAFDAQGVALLTNDHGRLHVSGYRGYTPESIERFNSIPLRAHLTPTVDALTSGVPGFFGSREELVEVYPDVPQVTGKKAWAVLPLITSGRPVGCCLLAYDEPHRFAADERTVLTSLAGLLAQALERARLYDTKHGLAHELQQALLPHALPGIPGLDVAARYAPATEGLDIGGDFYDVIRLGPTSAAAVIGDVQGHNAPAAALMGQVRTAVHAASGAPPDQVLARANRLLCDLDPGMFTTCLYVHLDLAAHRALLADAGHPPPVLRPPGRPARVLDLVPGPPLGIDPQARYPVAEIPFPAGTLLFLYTDGLVEARGVELDHAIAGICEQLDRVPPGSSPSRTTDGLLARARADGRHDDDIATLLLRAAPAAADPRR